MRRLVPLLVGFAFASFALADDAIEKPMLVLDAGGHTAKVCKVLFTPDGRELITVSDDKTIRLWDVPSGEPRRVLRPPIGPGPEGMLYAAALSPNGRTLAVGGFPPGSGKDGIPIYLISLSNGRIERVFKGHTNVIHALAFAPDGRRLASGSAIRRHGSGTWPKGVASKCCRGTPTMSTVSPSLPTADAWPPPRSTRPGGSGRSPPAKPMLSCAGITRR